MLVPTKPADQLETVLHLKVESLNTLSSASPISPRRTALAKHIKVETV